jgi:hypothetical protein
MAIYVGCWTADGIDLIRNEINRDQS